MAGSGDGGVTFSAGRPTNLDKSRARAYYASSKCRWGLSGYFFLSPIGCLFFFLFSGTDRPIQTEILSQRGVNPK